MPDGWKLRVVTEALMDHGAHLPLQVPWQTQDWWLQGSPMLKKYVARVMAAELQPFPWSPVKDAAGGKQCPFARRAVVLHIRS